MKTHFKPKAFFLPGLLLLLAGCYSAEFFPAPDYPNLRRSDINTVEIRTARPERAFQKLGTLVFKDFSGDSRSESFRDRLRREARERGAQGVWIAGRSLHHTGGFQTETRERRSGRRGPTGSIKGRVGILRIILFNYED